MVQALSVDADFSMAKTATLAAGLTGNRDSSAVNEEGRLRADTYAILASLLSAPPTRDLLRRLARIQPAPETPGSPPSPDVDPNDLAQAWQQIRLAAKDADLAALDDEYHDLFIGLGRGEVVPYGSWHLTGFLLEQPLSDLRDDLGALGIEPGGAHKDPEDHIAALCEAMALIIRAGDIDESRERRFFTRHIHSWAGKFFRELRGARSARFYRPVGLLGQRFIELENQYLNIQAH